MALIHDQNAKPEIVEILRKAFRFPSAEDAEASYKVLNIMATLDMMPDPAAWKIVQKVIARINPKVARVELSQVLAPGPVRNLEDSGFLPKRARSSDNQDSRACGGKVPPNSRCRNCLRQRSQKSTQVGSATRLRGCAN